MARAVASPSGSAPLPVVQYTKVEDEVSTQPAGVHDLQARSYGYNDFSDFRRPEHYIRHIEPLETELAIQVEYDMDEQDQEWLDAVNAERKKEQIDKVSYETFEIIMDRLEKEWFDLTKNLPKPDFAMPSEDSTCAVCDDSEGENSNAIVFCDGCNLAVHQECYGVPYIPEGQWLCRKCTVSPENPVSCLLCPQEGGAFKQAVHGEWIHLLCAMWVPETRVANDVFMEPITGVERISKQRWKLKCSLCDVREGACIQCTKASCFLAFHVTCARRDKLLMPMKTHHGTELLLQCYCEKHLPDEQREARAAALEAAPPSPTTKSARAYAKTYSQGAPLVPAVVVSRILEYTARIHVRRKPELVHALCRYWSLKREGRKLQQAELVQGVVSRALFPHEPRLRLAFEKIVGLDKSDYFKHPVSKHVVPDYFDVVDHPMCWDMIDQRLDRHEYWDVRAFKGDINLVLNNAMLYNKPGTSYHRAAGRIQNSAAPILLELENHGIEHDISEDALAAHPPNASLPPIGDLEPPLSVLNLLVSWDAVKDDLPIILKHDPVASLFSFEFAEMKPPPPPAPPRPPKPKRDRKAEKAERERRQQERIAAQAAQDLDASPGFRAPRTRGAHAAAAAFEAEATGTPSSPATGDDEERERREKERRRGRHPKPLIMQPGTPGMQQSAVEEIGKKDFFKRFDVGWILPENSKRGGRERVERPPMAGPPPKKKIKLDQPGSRLSVGTPASENQTLRDSTPPKAEPPPPIDTSAELPKREDELPEPDTPLEPHTKVVHGPNGRIIIEELDTPATRREKAMRKKAERARAGGVSESASAPAPVSGTSRVQPVAGPSSAAGPSRTPAVEDISDLSDLSDLDSGGEDDTGEGASTKRIAPPPPPPPPPAPPAEPGVFVLKDGEMLESGTLVWAKAETYPWWPAEIFDEDDEEVPVPVQNQGEVVRAKKPAPIHLVRFFDKTNSWQWLTLDRLLAFGENDELDQELLSPTSRRQRWKSHNMRSACRDAFRRAMAEQETNKESGEDDEGDADARGVKDEAKNADTSAKAS